MKKKINKKYFIIIAMVFFRDCVIVLNDPKVYFAVKRHYDYDNVASKMIKNQNEHCPEREYKLQEHDVLTPLETIGERVKVRKQENVPHMITSPKPTITIETPNQNMNTQKSTSKNGKHR